MTEQQKLFPGGLPPKKNAKRVKIRVTKETQNQLHRMRIRGLTMIESSELGSKLTKFVLNNLNNDKVIPILEADDDEVDDVIRETLSFLFIKN